MKVCKFGGSSLASAAQIRKVADIVASDPERRLVVVSAPGKRTGDDTKVTDLLIALAEARLAGGDVEEPLEAVVARYREIAAELGLGTEVADEVERDLRGRLAGDTSHRGKFLDTLKAAGEDNCAKLFAGYLASAGREAAYVSPKEAGLVLSDEFGNARCLPESYENLASLAQRPGITVFPGFFGHSPAGDVVTLPRGGSDITGAILAAAVKASVYENFTDVDHVYVANPTIVPEPQPLHLVTYQEMRELSYAGFSVFHEEALEPAFRAGVPVNIRNTNNPSAPGTMITVERTCPPDGPVVGLASQAGFAMIYVSKYLMNREVGFGRRLLEIFEDEGLSYEHTPSGIDNISVILRDAKLTPEKEARILGRIRKDLAADDVKVERDLALVMLVGECMRQTVGIAARATAALAKGKVNLEMINQGSSEVSMMFGIKARDNERAVRALYDAFFGK